MKNIMAYKTGETYHIETPNGIINIRPNLTDRFGRSVDSIEIIPDDCAGDSPVKLVTGKHNQRLIRLKNKRKNNNI